jgi:membrane-associated protease RseP (regulator of RpoE activity)
VTRVSTSSRSARPTEDELGEPEPESARERRTSVLLFLATLACVYLTYGYVWEGGDPLGDWETAKAAGTFSGALMSILLAHEMGHYIVARRHGFRLSLPYFIPFPAAFGTFGAVIRLRTLPRSRTALLEMGAAGPIAGAVVAFIAIAIGLPQTGPPPEIPAPELVVGDPAAWVVAIESALSWGPIGAFLEWLSPPVPEGHVPVLIFNNPPVMDLLGWLMMGEPPGRYDTLSPIAMAGWVGCLLTAINLVPIGQLDGGHILGALIPDQARRASRVLLGLALAAGLLWSGWMVWALLLLITGAWQNLGVPKGTELTSRARLVALVAVVLFLLTFMPVPVEPDSLPFTP